jgi:cysteine desulfurase
LFFFNPLEPNPNNQTSYSGSVPNHGNGVQRNYFTKQGRKTPYKNDEMKVNKMFIDTFVWQCECKYRDMNNDWAFYFDYNATSPVKQEVLEAMIPWLSGLTGNASSLHALGRKSKKAVEIAREQTAAFLKCRPDEVFFTSGATESLNLALRGITEAYFNDGGHIMSQPTEHKAVLDTLNHLKRINHNITFIPYHELNQDYFKLHQSVTIPNILTIMWVNNETGEIFPVEDAARWADEKNVIMICDATQAVGKIEINLEKIPLHALAFSGHKIYGPPGIGVLFLRRSRKRINPIPQITGGGHQENIRSGTLPVALIVGLGKACELAASNRRFYEKQIRSVRDYFESAIKKNFPDAEIVCSDKPRIFNTSMVVFPKPLNQIGMLWEKYAFSSGSACTSEKPEPSHVLMAMGYEKEKVKNAYRFSFGLYNTMEAADALVVDLVNSLK